MAALREIREETGIEGVIDGDLDSIEYWFYSREDQVRIHKVVHFFLVRFVSGDTVSARPRGRRGGLVCRRAAPSTA